MERWLELHRKNEAVIASLEEQIEKCEEMESNARTQTSLTASEAGSRRVEKIRDIRRTNEELEERIESAKGRLGR